MAEVLGLMASGIAVVQLADQIVGSIRCLNEFWQSVRDAPRNVKDILEELEMLGDTLLELQSDMGHQHGSVELQGTASAKCIQYCRKTADELESIVLGLQQGLDGKKLRRQWTVIKAAFQKGALQDLQERLDRAKSMLSLAINCYSLSIHRQSISLLLSNMAMQREPNVPVTLATQDGESITESTVIKQGASRSRAIKTTKKWSFIGSYQYQKTTTPAIWPDSTQGSVDEFDDDNIVIEWKILPAAWLRLRALSFQSMKTRGAWQYSLKPLRVIPSEHPIFKASESGNINAIIEILKSGSVSLNDVQPNGSNLLHYAASHGHPQLCKWLIDQGIDTSAVDDDLRTPLYLVDRPRRTRKEDEDRLTDTARVLVECGQIDPMSVGRRGVSMLHFFCGSVGVYKYLVQSQQQFFIDLCEVNTHGQTPFSRKIDLLTPNMPKLLRFLLGDGQISSRSAKEVWFNGANSTTLLLGSAKRLSANFQDIELSGIEIKFINDLIRAGADVHMRGQSGGTPLDQLLTTWWAIDWPETNKECLIVAWLRCLSQSGVNLHDYFRREQELHEDGKIVPIWEYRKWIVRKFEVYYGDSPDDITLLVEDHWQKPQDASELPGSWDTEAEYAEAHRLHLSVGLQPTATWSVSTAGFKDDDFSAQRAGCDEDLPVRERQKLVDLLDSKGYILSPAW